MRRWPHRMSWAVVAAFGLGTAACSSGPQADGNQAEVDAAAQALAGKADAAANKVIAELEAEAARDADALNASNAQ